MSSSAHLSRIADLAQQLQQAIKDAEAEGYQVSLHLLPTDYSKLAEHQFGVRLPTYVMTVQGPN